MRVWEPLDIPDQQISATLSDAEVYLVRIKKNGLLDEADIFLQRRDTLHLERNRLVGVFFRKLEYFGF